MFMLIRTKGLTEEPSGKSDGGTVKQRKMSKKNADEDPKARALTSTNSDRYQIYRYTYATVQNAGVTQTVFESYMFLINRSASESVESDLDAQLHCSSSSEAEPRKAMLREESPPLASAFAPSKSFEENVLDLK